MTEPLPVFTGANIELPNLGQLAGVVADDEPSEITLECPECGEPITGAAKGKNSASWKMGTHKYTKHKISKAGGGSKKTVADPGESATPIIGLAQSMAAAAGDSKRVPTANDLANGLGRGLGLVTIIVASALVESDPTIPDTDDGDRTRDYLTDYLSLDDKAAKGIMSPVGKMLAPTALNKKYGRGVIENVDVIASLAELGTLAMHYRKYFRLRTAGRPLASVSPINPAAGAGMPPAFELGLASPAPQAGIVLTPDAIRDLQKGL